MYLSEALGINREGHLTVGGVDALELAAQYGTPLYVMDESLIRRECGVYKQAIDNTITETA